MLYIYIHYIYTIYIYNIYIHYIYIYTLYIYIHTLYIYIHYMKRFRQLCCQSVAADAVRAFCTVGQKFQAQGLLIQDVASNIQ